MFNLDNIFVCQVSEKIVGIVLWHKGPLNWSEEELEAAAEKYGRLHPTEEPVVLPTTLSNVAKEYISDYSAAQDISLLNVCVDKEARRQGIGRKILTEFMKLHEKSDFDLCVLSYNKHAIGLYKSLGFAETGVENAYPMTLGHTRKNMKKARTDTKGDQKNARLSQ